MAEGDSVQQLVEHDIEYSHEKGHQLTMQPPSDSPRNENYDTSVASDLEENLKKHIQNSEKVTSNKEPIPWEYQGSPDPKPTTWEHQISSDTKPTTWEHQDSADLKPTVSEHQGSAHPKPTANEHQDSADLKPTAGEHQDSADPEPIAGEHQGSTDPKPTANEHQGAADLKPTVGEHQCSADPKPTADEHQGSADHKLIAGEHQGSADLKTNAGEHQDSAYPEPTAGEHQGSADPKPTANGHQGAADLKPTVGEHQGSADPKPTANEHQISSDTKPTTWEHQGSADLKPTVSEHQGSAHPKPTANEHQGSADLKPTVGEHQGSADLKPTAGEHQDSADPEPIAGEHQGSADPEPIAGEHQGSADPKPTAYEHQGAADLKLTVGEHQGSADLKPTAGEHQDSADQEPIAGEHQGSADQKPTANEHQGSADEKLIAGEYQGSAYLKPTVVEHQGSPDPKPTPWKHQGSANPEPASWEHQGSADLKPTANEHQGSADLKPTAGEHQDSTDPTPTVGEHQGSTDPKPTVGEHQGSTDPKPADGEHQGSTDPKPTVGEHHDSAVAYCLEGEVITGVQFLSKTDEFQPTIEDNFSLKSKEAQNAISRCAKEISSKIDQCHKRKEAIVAAEDDIRVEIVKKVSEIEAQLESYKENLLKQLVSRKTDKLREIDNILTNGKLHQKKLINLQGIFLCKESFAKNYKMMENTDFLKCLLKEKEVFVQRPIPSFDMVFRENKTTKNILGTLEVSELAENRPSEAQTLDGYKKLLIDIYRTIADAGDDYSKTTAFSEKEVAKLHSLDYLQNVQIELGLSDASKRFEYIQATHTRIASLLFALTEPGTDSSSDQGKGHLPELQACITKLWNNIQFIIHQRKSEIGLMAKGFQNYGNTCYFNSVLQCLLQTVPLSFELTLNLDMFLKEFTLSEAYMILASTYNESEQRKAALTMLYYKFKEGTQRFNDGGQHDSHDLLIHFLDKLRVEERNAKKIPSAGPETQKILTAVDRIFGGQFITVYTCHSCQEPYAIREPFLDISIPLCTLSVDEKKPEGNKTKPTTPSENHMNAPNSSTSLMDKFTNLFSTSGTSDAQSQQVPANEVKNDAENLSTYEASHCPSLTVDHSPDADRKRNVIKTMLETLSTDELLAESEVRIPQSRTVLGFKNKTPDPTVSQCLKYFSRAELIKDEYLCRNCQTSESDDLQMTSATKRTLISSPPAILVLHLKRFEQKSTGFVKRDEMISYDEFLDLGPFCSFSALRIDPEEENVWYSLYAVVVHSGFFLSQGHYVAYIKQRDSSAQMEDQLRENFLQKNFGDREKVPNDDDLAAMEKRKAIKKREKAKRPRPIPGKWFYTSDHSVRSCDSKEALDQKAFLLFYERIPGSGNKSTGV